MVQPHQYQANPRPAPGVMPPQVQAIPLPLPLVQSFVVAQYFTDDLEELVRLTHTDLMEMLQIPASYGQPDNKDILLLLYQDISHMVRDNVISGLHLLLCDANLNSNNGYYPLRYHAFYKIDLTTEREAIYSNTSNEFRSDSRLVQPPKEVLQNCRLVILIDWNPAIGEGWREIRRPKYCFDWMNEVTSFDAQMLVDYRDGYLEYGHTSPDPADPAKKIFATDGKGEGRVVTRMERIAPS